ncbi:MAG TPA: hypothetical protein VD966_01360, partial [Pyrinomonadaceae bacterium]|nr:hypothetical protein [Pyrinomonadaceae bacterium]
MPRKISRCFFTFLIVLSLTATLSSAEPGQKIVRRVQFERGRTTVVLKGTIRHGQEIVYVLRASKGQTLTAHITATTPNNDVVFSIEGPGGRELTDGI